MTLAELQTECHAVMQTTLTMIKEHGEMTLAMCHLYGRDEHGQAKLDLMAIDMPKHGRERDVIRDLIAFRILVEDTHAVIFACEAWSAACPPEEIPLLDQWRADHDGSLQGSPWTRDTVVVCGACPEGESTVLMCILDETRSPGPITSDTIPQWSRFTGNLPWPKRRSP